ncbi:MAG: exosortase U [Planctomycetota bacterium]
MASSKPQPAANEIVPWKILLPYGLAVLAQLPMLLLYFRGLLDRPHYQPFGFAIVATAGLAMLRWPFEIQPAFRQSITSFFLLFLGLASAFFSLLFVEPWFSALSFMLLISSLLASTNDKDAEGTLWPCSLPLYVYLILPNQLDFTLITRLQQYSAVYTSRMLDLLGLGHHMDGTLIKVPGVQEYGIEQACSGVQSFFTLLLVAVVFIVMSRRIQMPGILGWFVGLLMAMVCYILHAFVIPPGAVNQLLFGLMIGLIFYAFVGFRAALLIMSAVFWAIFMNTIRIMVIPLSEYILKIDLSHGISHDILGYVVLTLGILLLFSTDQFIFFLFGPVDSGATQGSSAMVRMVNRFWNSVLAGESSDSESPGHRRRSQNPSKAGLAVIWAIGILMTAMGLWQLSDVRASLNAEQKMLVRFFDSDPTIDFVREDLAKTYEDWERLDHETTDRTRGSDLGQRSDTWRFQSPSVSTHFSVDQPFPGWHELTTCYKNVGWKLVERKVVQPSQILDSQPDESDWAYIEARFERNTGEKGYLLFSLFDSFGNPMQPPTEWGTVNSFFIRARNRLSNRIRASLFQGEAFQNQIFVTTFNELSDGVKLEVNMRYLEIREDIREKFIERRQANTGPANSSDAANAVEKRPSKQANAAGLTLARNHQS